MPERFRNVSGVELVIPRFHLRVPPGGEFEVPDTDDQDSLGNQPLLLQLSGQWLTGSIRGAVDVITGSGSSATGGLVALDSPTATAAGALTAIVI